MKPFIAVVRWNELNRVEKYQPFDAQASAVGHVIRYGGFSIANPGGLSQDWLVDPVYKTVSVDPLPSKPALTKDEIYERVMQNQRVLRAVVLAYIRGNLVVGLTAAQAKAVVKAEM